MKTKIWEVKIGDNFDRRTVKAKNYIEAGRKAMKLAQPVFRNEKYVSEVCLIAEAE